MCLAGSASPVMCGHRHVDSAGRSASQRYRVLKHGDVALSHGCRVDDVDGLTQQILQVHLKPGNIEEVGIVVEVHEEVEVAAVGVIAAGNRTHQRDGSSPAAPRCGAYGCPAFQNLIAPAHASTLTLCPRGRRQGASAHAATTQLIHVMFPVALAGEAHGAFTGSWTVDLRSQ